VSRTVLVTGGAGFVGSHLIQRILEETDWDVLSVDSFTAGGKFINLLDACNWDRERVVSITHDLTVPLTARQVDFTLERGVTHVVNVASRSHVDESIRDPLAFVSNNVQLTLNTLNLARELRVERFVQISTDEVYGPNDPASCTDYRPSSPYAASKAAQESLCLAWARTYRLPLTIVNSANMIGERQQDGAFLPIVVDDLRNGRIVQVHTAAGKLGIRHYSYVGNVVDELLAELRRSRPAGRLQLPGQQTFNNLELVEEIAKIVGVTPKWQVYDVTQYRPGYDQHYPVLPGDWTPRVTFDEALERTVRWYLES
jgi:dTDP-glucose 4,6-dehydratase